MVLLGCRDLLWSISADHHCCSPPFQGSLIAKCAHQPVPLLPPCIRLLMILSFGGGCPEGLMLMFSRVFGSAGQFLGCSRNSDSTDFKNKGRNPEPFCENSQGKPFPTSPLLSPSLPSCPFLFPPFPPFLFFSSPPLSPPFLFWGWFGLVLGLLGRFRWGGVWGSVS